MQIPHQFLIIPPQGYMQSINKVWNHQHWYLNVKIHKVQLINVTDLWEYFRAKIAIITAMIKKSYISCWVFKELHILYPTSVIQQPCNISNSYYYHHITESREAGAYWNSKFSLANSWLRWFLKLRPFWLTVHTSSLYMIKIHMLCTAVWQPV